MMNRWLVLVSGMLISCSSYAATVSLSPTTLGAIAANSSLAVDLVIDAADAPGGHVLGTDASGLYVGSVKLGYDSDLLIFDSFNLNSNFSTKLSAPGVSATPGEVSFYFFDADFDMGNLGTFNFTTTDIFSTTTLTLADNNTLGSFENQVAGDGTATNEKFVPEFSGATLETAVIPIPAAVWLFLSGMGLLFGISRSKDRI